MSHRILTAIVAFGFVAAIASPASAFCGVVAGDITPGGGTVIFDCDDELLPRDAQVDLERGTWLTTKDMERAESWPLGDTMVKACRHCLDPNPQEAERLRQADPQSQQ
jgi:hypothetical protein